MSTSWFARLTLSAFILALCVVVLGAYVRLSDAGLGCPDWPGCYGRLAVPQQAEEVQAANRAYPARPVETAKAWKEMIHRYLAALLGLLIVGMAVLAVVARRRQVGQPVKLPLFLVALVIFQGLLGMWTVTLLLKPAVVMAHLLGGMITLALLWWLWLRQRGSVGAVTARGRALRGPATLALAVVVAQIALGGWTSANYAALACTEFPTCYAGQWWPPMDFSEGFMLWRGIGVDYEHGVLEHPARVAIQTAHRLGALVTLLAVGWLVWKALRAQESRLQRAGAVVLVLLLAQLSLGIANVLWSLALPVAVAHNAGAALLLLGLVAFQHLLRPTPY